MMKIYERQIAVLAEARADELERRIVQLLRKRNAGALALGESVLRREVRDRVLEAQAAGLETERQVAAYAVGAWCFGDAFIRAIEPLWPRLESGRVDPAVKASLLLDRIAALSRAAKPPTA